MLLILVMAAVLAAAGALADANVCTESPENN